MTTNLEQLAAEILIVEDEVAHAEALAEGLGRVGHRCTVVHDGADAITKLHQAAFDIIITDLMLGPGPDGLAVLAAAREHAPDAKGILITAHSTVETCRTALRNGAFDYIEKPLDLDDLRGVVARAAELSAQKGPLSVVREPVETTTGFENIVGQSAPMTAVLDTLRRVAQSDIAVLLLGESGTGKELFANAVHQNSPRANKPFVAINCAGLSETLLEDELFGHVRGAYTGATSDRPGRFEHADGGTLFLDEIGDMPAAMQAKLLRVLENGEVVRVGANEPIRVDVRIVSATNADLAEKVATKEFREDLYYRIKGAPLTIPPLRKRRDDIGLLIDHFLQLATQRYPSPVESVSPEARRLLMAYSWPGNVRQLRNVVENMIVLSAGAEAGVDALPEEVHTRPAVADDDLPQLAGISIAEAERQLIKNTLELTDGKREAAAQLLGIGERTLYRKIKEYEL
ncbi:MAG: sigma-54-dependent Fis family transcriptional regulator [Phycisphaerales bacterium]|nr:sigma-54-dependent Fis family transcriptional regulator [Phycisphaerales bacterium]